MFDGLVGGQDVFELGVRHGQQGPHRCGCDAQPLRDGRVVDAGPFEFDRDRMRDRQAGERDRAVHYRINGATVSAGA